ncbi:hypothetical protein BGW36DRAFT_369289 [Talaromyces proteolyticus]|uniref:gamma-glutamylcyclotransferase n=1 Tax=Talaromyces proteolyticus TaxID=1131652 RepID=A0AAD4KXL0_9EURO|nr:uncharacterized protein BGW36DRAFT_369289 [Talaromyces proteolyticus]KAH8703406.1 hypothetical protein BGW36DRAFT_369289 [Talaromyces proteolyticus]
MLAYIRLIVIRPLLLLFSLEKMESRPTPPSQRLPRTSPSRLQSASKPASAEADPSLSQTLSTKPASVQQAETVLYLAYGSNLSTETFRGYRGITPLSQINVYVPDLRLTFDLAAVPYLEPCFAGTQYRTDQQNPNTAYTDEKTPLSEAHLLDSSDIEKTPLVNPPPYGGTDYHKNRWHKPLIGVVYEVSLKDYAHIIATEGGGSGYKDIVVTCHPFAADYNPSHPTPTHPSTTPFMAHTLLSPWTPDGAHGDDPHIRPDPAYAQPSARYLKLIMDGAAELDLPEDYRAYLAGIRPYQVTTWRQMVGRALFLGTWGLLTLFVMVLARWLADEKGIMPPWVARLQRRCLRGMWKSYDVSFRRVFGDGERTIGDVSGI